MKRVQQVFKPNRFEIDKRLECSFVLLRSNESDGQRVSPGMMFSFCRVEMKHNSKRKEEVLTFVQCMQFADAMCKYDKLLESVCSGLITTDEHDYSKRKEEG